jgi:hypothetical protein
LMFEKEIMETFETLGGCSYCALFPLVSKCVYAIS